MPTLLFSLIVQLERYDFGNSDSLHGPIFHRWLPDGEKDSISIKTKSKNVKVLVWFERCGFVKNGWIEFDYKKREVNSAILKRQAKLDAGPLRVRIEVKGITDKDIRILKSNKKGNDSYIRLGKRLLKILYESIIPFIDTLRLYYGQYWLPELENWNSKDESLSSYFKYLYTKFSTDHGKTWKDFIPDKFKKEIRNVFTVQTDFSSYLSRECWKKLDYIDLSEFESTLAIKLLQTAHKLKDEGNYKQAIIEGSTSLEVAISDLFKNKLSLSQKLKNEMGSFWQLPIRTQLIVISSLIEGLSVKSIENAIDIVKIRNKIVHDGFSPKIDFNKEKMLDGFFRVISKIISDKPIKFPSASISGNFLLAEEGKNE